VKILHLLEPADLLFLEAAAYRLLVESFVLSLIGRSRASSTIRNEAAQISTLIGATLDLPAAEAEARERYEVETRRES